jgi:hypothetical protein
MESYEPARAGLREWTVGVEELRLATFHELEMERPPLGLSTHTSCPLRDVCAIRTAPQRSAMDPAPEAGRASAGSQAAWQANAFISFWLGDDDHAPN